MKITIELLNRYGACENQRILACKEFDLESGVEPTRENLIRAYDLGLDIFWLLCLLPEEGLVSKRAFSLRCARSVMRLNPDPRMRQCLDVVSRRVEDPDSVSDYELCAARASAMAAASSASMDAAWDASYAAAWSASHFSTRSAASAAARASAGAASYSAAWASDMDADRRKQIVWLSEILMAIK